MSKRITLITKFKEEELEKINKLIPKEIKTCKVPFGIDDINRYNIDNLPYHITIFATDKDNQEEFIKIIKITSFDKIKLKVNQVKIMNGRNDSYVLYLGIEESESLKNLQRIFHNKFPKEHYNPENFIFHITLHIDKDYNNVLCLQKEVLKNFKTFYLEFEEMMLYNYPGDEIIF